MILLLLRCCHSCRFRGRCHPARFETAVSYAMPVLMMLDDDDDDDFVGVGLVHSVDICR